MTEDTIPVPAESARQLAISAAEEVDQLGLVKLLDVFLGKGAKPLTSSQLEEFTGVNQSTVSRATDQLAAAGIIKTSDEGDAYKYWLNDGHPAVDGLEEAHFELHLQADTIQTASPEFDSEHDNEHYHAGSPFVELFRYPTNVKLVAASATAGNDGEYVSISADALSTVVADSNVFDYHKEAARSYLVQYGVWDER
jgi:DNA-binding transcriptional MocR family regulator